MKRRLTQDGTRQRIWRRTTNAASEKLEASTECPYDLFEGLFEEKTNRMVPVRVATVSPVIIQRQHSNRVSLITYRSQFTAGRKT